jgi:putative glutamine amidotransferase
MTSVRIGVDRFSPVDHSPFGSGPNLIRAVCGRTDGILTTMLPAASRPLIGVSTYRQVTSWWSWERDAALVPGAYLDMVVATGGQPVLIPPLGPSDVAADAATLLDGLVGVLDGLILIGGGDVGPERYGQVPDPRNGGSSEQRDALEIELLDAALLRDLPVLAICRGLQVLNVTLGGDLVQQLPDVLGSNGHQPGPGAFSPVSIVTDEGSSVRRVLGERVDVLCSHHQAIGKLGRGLVVTATSEDGIIEAVELPDHRFVVGVQWHPEESGDTRLFAALVAAARAEQVAPTDNEEQS